MRCGITVYIQGYQDWDRFEAAERGEKVVPLADEFDSRRYAEEIDSALELEELGFDSLWTIEHHVSPYTMVTNPLQLLSYFAGATKRMDVGTMVVVLPWHHPLRVAEDMTMLQHLLKGRRAFIGFGRGAARREFGQLGFDMNESKERFAEAAQIIKLALSQEVFSFHGDYYKFDRATMRPRPRDAARLIEDMHFSWGTPSSAPVGARLGLKPMIVPQRAWSEYHDDLAAFSKARHEIGLPAVRPRLHMAAYCADTEQKARENAARHMSEYTDSATRNYETYSSHFSSIRGYEHYAERARGISDQKVLAKVMGKTWIDNHVWGTPEQCIEKIRGIASEFRPEEFMFVMRFGSMSKDVADDSIRLFAKEVLPAMREMKVLPPVDYHEAAE
jgi:alkanesulfonate monooxygenase SsuD/methylene tetrahydromethanopterin reductase-like flavin-dependent oxidoreductase (luciferase family)